MKFQTPIEFMIVTRKKQIPDSFCPLFPAHNSTLWYMTFKHNTQTPINPIHSYLNVSPACETSSLEITEDNSYTLSPEFCFPWILYIRRLYTAPPVNNSPGAGSCSNVRGCCFLCTLKYTYARIHAIIIRPAIPPPTMPPICPPVSGSSSSSERIPLLFAVELN